MTSIYERDLLSEDVHVHQKRTINRSKISLGYRTAYMHDGVTHTYKPTPAKILCNVTTWVVNENTEDNKDLYLNCHNNCDVTV